MHHFSCLLTSGLNPWKIAIPLSKISLRGVRKDSYKNWHIDKAFKRPKISILNSKLSKKRYLPNSFLHKALRSPADQQESLPVHSVSTVFSQMTTILSDGREGTNRSLLAKLDTFLLTAWARIFISEANVDISWYKTGFLDDDLNF